MIKKHLMLLSVSAAFYLQAQDISVTKNTIDVYSVNSMNGSAKFNAMAGATGALGGDGDALLNNPAGLGVAISSSLGGTLSLETYKNESSLANSTTSYNNQILNIGNVNGIASFQLMSESGWKFVNLGVNFSTQTLDNYVESPGNSNVAISKDLLDTNNNPVTGELSYVGHAYNRTGYLSKMSFGLGANYDNRIYLGMGLNFHGSDIEQYDSALLKLDLDNNVYSFDKQYTPFTEQASGFSANFGIIGKVSNQLRLGAALETPTWWSMERIYTKNFVDNSGYISYENYGENRSLRSPFKATLSAALVPNKNFSINADYSVGLTRPTYREEGPAEAELNNFFEDNYKNMSELKVGAEYRIKQWRLRGGYSFANNPFDKMTINAFNNAGQTGSASYDDLMLGSRSIIGLGLGYAFQSFFIDVAYQNQSMNFSNPFLAGYEDYGTGYYSADFDVNSDAYVVSDVKQTRNNFFVTFGWKF